MQPGALHRTRWMARVIYSIKICLFQKQFVMKRCEPSGIKRFATFALSVYVRSWFLAPEAVRAPTNEIGLSHMLASYTDCAISKARSIGFSKHLWY